MQTTIVSSSFRRSRQYVEQVATLRADDLAEPITRRADLVRAVFKSGDILMAIPNVEEYRRGFKGDVMCMLDVGQCLCTRAERETLDALP